MAAAAAIQRFVSTLVILLTCGNKTNEHDSYEDKNEDHDNDDDDDGYVWLYFNSHNQKYNCVCVQRQRRNVHIP